MKKLFFVLIAVVSTSVVYAQSSQVESAHVLFSGNSANLGAVSPELALQNQRVLVEIAQVLLENPGYRILIDGHANPVLRTTREERNILSSLSLQRATAVANYLVEFFGIGRQRLILTGNGGRLAGNNATQNRRVSLFIIADSVTLDITRRDLTEDINNLIPDDIFEAIGELGIEIHGGRNPPNIEGTFIFSPAILVKSNFSDFAHPEDQFGDGRITFSKQDDDDLTVFSEYIQGDIQDGSGSGSFITGSGNKFSVFVENSGTIEGYPQETVDIFSGEITPFGINNFQWATMVTVEAPVSIKRGQGRLFYDSDGFSEKVER